MDAYALDLLEGLDDDLILSSEKNVDYGRIRKRKYTILGLAAAAAAAALLYVCIPVQQKITVSVFADDGKTQITESGSIIRIDSLSETNVMSKGLFEIKIHASKKTRLCTVSRWENGVFVGSADYTKLNHYIVKPDAVIVEIGGRPSKNWFFIIPVLWENWDVYPLEEILKFEFEDGTVIHKKITVEPFDDRYWLATISDYEE